MYGFWLFLFLPFCLIQPERPWGVSQCGLVPTAAKGKVEFESVLLSASNLHYNAQIHCVKFFKEFYGERSSICLINKTLQRSASTYTPTLNTKMNRISYIVRSRSSHQRCSIKKVFLRISQNAEACNFIKKEALAQVFSCEFCEIFKNTFFTEHLRTTTSL